MGYAIKLNLASAPNLGLGKVTILNDQAKYIADNFINELANVSSTEEQAVRDLISGLVDIGLYEKFKLILPMVGSSVADKLVDVVSPTNKKVYNALNTAGLVAGMNVDANNMLVPSSASTTVSLTFDDFGSRAYSLITGGYVNQVSSTGLTVASTELLFQLATGGNEYFYATINGTAFPASSDQKNYKNRLLTFTYDGETAKIYKDDTIFATQEKTGTLAQIEFYRFLSFSVFPQTFFALADELTSEEIAAMYELVTAFNTSLGRIL